MSDDQNYRGVADVLVLQAARSSPEAFGVLFERHAPQIRGWCLTRVNYDLHVANDITAETFAQALRCLNKFDESRADASVAGWLYGIAANTLRYWQRRERVRFRARERVRMNELQYVDDLNDIEVIDEKHLETPASDALATLPNSQRQAVQLRVLDELPYAECAARLGCTPQTARQHVSRGLRTLKTRTQGATQ